MTTHYRSSTHGLVPIAEMHEAHLANAISKLELATVAKRDFATLKALEAERDRRRGDGRS